MECPPHVPLLCCYAVIFPRRRHPLLVWVLSQRSFSLAASHPLAFAALGGTVATPYRKDQAARNIISRVLLPAAKLGHSLDRVQLDMLEERISQGLGSLDITHFK